MLAISPNPSQTMAHLRRVAVISIIPAVLLAGFAFRPHVSAVRAAAVSEVEPPAPFFPAGSIWTQDVTSAPLDPRSDATIQWLSSAGGWGTGKMHVDFAIRVLQADASTQKVKFRPGKVFYMTSSDRGAVPLPAGGGMEGHPGYQCPSDQEDCHLIVVDRADAKLYEIDAANFDGKALTGAVLVVWDLNRVYPPSGRGDQCTSSDAAGFPVAPLLFTADELAAGHIDHAIRFLLPNERIRADVFVRPATHAGGPTGPDAAPPYGVHLRLKASYDVSHLKPAAQVVARAMQKYGMLLADGGNLALTAQNDADTKTKYSDVGFEANDLRDLKVSDFEVLREGPVIPVTNDCLRNH